VSGVEKLIPPVLALANFARPVPNDDPAVYKRLARKAAVNLVMQHGDFSPDEIEFEAPTAAVTTKVKRNGKRITPDPGRRHARVKLIRRSISEEEMRQGAEAAAGLLHEWQPARVTELIDDAALDAKYYVRKDGSVDIAAYVDAALPQLAALSLGLAMNRDGSLKQHVGQCRNPSCKKWFIATKRRVADKQPGQGEGQGLRTHCSPKCANAHQQLKRAADYDLRCRTNDYPLRPCVRC
jgi:hypothetical protein